MYIKIWFTDQNPKLLEIEVKINITLVINCATYKNDVIFVKRYGFLSFAKNMGKNLSGKCSQKLSDQAKQSATDALKSISKIII